MVRFGQKGNFEKTTRFFGTLKKSIDMNLLNEYGRQGVLALSSATPVDTGLTASSWYYKIERTKTKISLNFYNSNVINDWLVVAIVLQYGHATQNGGWVEGKDFINPAIQPIFDKLAEVAWREVVSE